MSVSHKLTFFCNQWTGSFLVVRKNTDLRHYSQTANSRNPLKEKRPWNMILWRVLILSKKKYRKILLGFLRGADQLLLQQQNVHCHVRNLRKCWVCMWHLLLTYSDFSLHAWTFNSDVKRHISFHILWKKQKHFKCAGRYIWSELSVDERPIWPLITRNTLSL